MSHLLQRLWRDQRGSINSAELMMIMTLLCIGMLVGIKSLRDSAVTEFADMAQAIANLDQSYSLAASSMTASSSFLDELDFCDDPTIDEDVGAAGSKCVNVCVQATGEGN